jgi:enoyl-CoA hydratase/carnithine racemase
MGAVITDGAVLLDVDLSVATITFNRPEKLNAADLAQSHALEAEVAAVRGCAGSPGGAARGRSRAPQLCATAESAASPAL